MAGFNTIFERTEIKYLVPQEKKEAFLRAIEPYMQLDEYGLSTICNIYYDTENDDLISRSLDAPAYKEKLRLRSYGVPKADGTVFPELKKKVNGIVYKRRAAMKLGEAEAFLSGRSPQDGTQILREIDYFREFYKPVPKLFIAYDRRAYFGKEDHGFRLTTDENIRFRTDRLSLSEGDDGELLNLGGAMLVEIKCAGAMPRFMVEILSKMKIYPTSFSKYGRIYEQMHRAPAAAASKAEAKRKPTVQRTEGRRIFGHLGKSRALAG